MSDELVLYTNPMSRGRIARWMLEEVGRPYRTEVIGYGPAMKGAYKAINPMGKVPAISSPTPFPMPDWRPRRPAGCVGLIIAGSSSVRDRPRRL